MPKRLSVDTNMAMAAPHERPPPAKAQKTERSHEENQERAYIAASRRADRSLEARVQSAKMASEIHRRRTGRGLKVNEEIVLAEEMYEEEEDDLPRHYKYLTAHLQTNSPEMNHRVNAFITTQTAMATFARYNEVNRLFSESFPSAAAYQQQLNNSMYMAPLGNGDGSFTHPGQRTGSVPGPSHTSPTPAPARSPSVAQISSVDRRASAASGSPAPNTPALSPGAATAETESKSPYPPPHANLSSFSNLDPQLAQQSGSSSFTCELPNEVKRMANIDMSDPMAIPFFGGNMSPFTGFGQYGLHLQTSNEAPAQENADLSPTALSPSDESEENALFSPFESSMPEFYPDFSTGHMSQVGTPGAGAGDAWFGDFVDLNQSEQQ